MSHLFLLLFYTMILALTSLSLYVRCDMTCHNRVDSKDSHKVDLSYMFTDNELHLLKNHHSHEQFLPGLEALARPYFALVATKNLEDQDIDDLPIGAMTINSKSGHYLRARYGEMRLGKAFLLSINVSAVPFVKLSTRLVLSNLQLKFLEYNATISTGDYIGYNLKLGVDLEVVFEIELEPVGSSAMVHLYQGVVGASQIKFTDLTDCKTVERRKDLNFGRVCGEQVFVEMAKWDGSGTKIIEFLKPVIFKAIHCSVKDIIHDVVEMCASYAVMLAK